MIFPGPFPANDNGSDLKDCTVRAPGPLDGVRMPLAADGEQRAGTQRLRGMRCLWVDDHKRIHDALYGVPKGKRIGIAQGLAEDLGVSRQTVETSARVSAANARKAGK